jgi:hypothetical protein
LLYIFSNINFFDSILKEIKMKGKVILLIGCLFLLAGFICIDRAFAWEAALTATGSASDESEVIIGVDATAATLPAPPAPPQYSVLMNMYPPDWNAKYYKDVRLDGDESYMWILEVDPNGNTPPPVARTSSIIWDPLEFGGYVCELRSGWDGTGTVIFADMSAATSYDVTSAELQYFNVICGPAF